MCFRLYTLFAEACAFLTPPPLPSDCDRRRKEEPPVGRQGEPGPEQTDVVSRNEDAALHKRPGPEQATAVRSGTGFSVSGIWIRSALPSAHARWSKTLANLGAVFNGRA